MTTGDKIFGITAILLGIAIVVVTMPGLLVTPWVLIVASSLGISWLSVARRRDTAIKRGPRSGDRRP